MNSSRFLHQLSERFSPRTWLAVAALSLVVASGSGVLLLSRQGVQPEDVFLPAYDWARRFTRDTIRLTFKTDEGPQETVFVAPLGILDPARAFKSIDKFDDFVPRVETVIRQPVAPLQVLESEWLPVFSGKKEDVDS